MNEIKYEFPMFSSNLICEPDITIRHMDVIIKLEGYDDNGVLSKICVTFSSVLGMKQTSARFTPKLYGAYDKIVEVLDSEWLLEMCQINKDDYDYWNPKHYLMYLDGMGLYQFIAKSLKVEKYD